jgi:cytochrome c-type biogenesis protein CcmH/NrfG
MAALERANKLNPKDAETFCEIGNAFVRQGNQDTALKAYEAAVREDPKSVCGIAGAFHAHPTARGKPTPSVVLAGLVTRSRDAWEKAFLQATLARVHLEERDGKSALAVAEEATTTAPASPTAWFALGEVLRRQKLDERAHQAYLRAAELDGSWSAAHLALADLLARRGGEGIPRAIAEYELVLQTDQNELDVNRARKAAAALKKQSKEP